MCQTNHMSSVCEKINVLPVGNTTSVSAKRDRCTAVLFQRCYIGKQVGGTRCIFCKCKNTCVSPLDSTIMSPKILGVVTSPLTETPVLAQELGDNLVCWTLCGLPRSRSTVPVHLPTTIASYDMP